MTYDVVPVGEDGQSVLVIDDVFDHAHDLVGLAARLAPFPTVSKNLYPGDRLILKPDHGPEVATYVDTMCTTLLPIMKDVFGLHGFQVVEAGLSLVTTPPQALVTGQRIPHYDTTDMGRFAVLHYLGRPDQGGTAFYRHRTTGFEVISPERQALYKHALEIDVDLDPPQAGYLRGSTPIFEQTAAFEARFNRVIIYRSTCLHCGIIPDDLDFSADPSRGRLTANLFLAAR